MPMQFVKIDWTKIATVMSYCYRKSAVYSYRLFGILFQIFWFFSGIFLLYIAISLLALSMVQLRLSDAEALSRARVMGLLYSGGASAGAFRNHWIDWLLMSVGLLVFALWWLYAWYDSLDGRPWVRFGEIPQGFFAKANRIDPDQNK